MKVKLNESMTFNRTYFRITLFSTAVERHYIMYVLRQSHFAFSFCFLEDYELSPSIQF